MAQFEFRHDVETIAVNFLAGSIATSRKWSEVIRHTRCVAIRHH